MSQRFANKIAIVKPHNDERREAWLRSIPLARCCEPAEMAAAA